MLTVAKYSTGLPPAMIKGAPIRARLTYKDVSRFEASGRGWWAMATVVNTQVVDAVSVLFVSRVR